MLSLSALWLTAWFTGLDNKAYALLDKGDTYVYLVRFDQTSLQYLYRIQQLSVAACIDRSGDYYWLSSKKFYKIAAVHTLDGYSTDSDAPLGPATGPSGALGPFADGRWNTEVRAKVQSHSVPND